MYLCLLCQPSGHSILQRVSLPRILNGSFSSIRCKILHLESCLFSCRCRIVWYPVPWNQLSVDNGDLRKKISLMDYCWCLWKYLFILMNLNGCRFRIDNARQPQNWNDKKMDVPNLYNDDGHWFGAVELIHRKLFNYWTTDYATWLDELSWNHLGVLTWKCTLILLFTSPAFT